MESVQSPEETVRIRAENVGGIDAAEVRFRPGVNLLTGWNASNRTSLLRAVMAALGSDRASLKGDANAGLAELEHAGEIYHRSIERRDGEVVFTGRPYTEDSELADLFGFLLESNEARQAVARGDDLRELIMRPVDTEAIQAEIEAIGSRLRDIESELEERERLEEEANTLEAERTELEVRIEEERDALAEKRAAIETADAEIDESRERKSELETELEALQTLRSELEDVRFRLETERESIDSLRDELDNVEAEIEELTPAPREELDTIEERTETLRARKRRLDSKVNQLQLLIQFNEEVIESDEMEGLDVLGIESDEVTDGLLPEAEAFICWTCGGEASRSDIEAMLEDLRERRATLVEKRQEVRSELDESKVREESLAQHEQHRSELEGRREALEAEIEATEVEIASSAERQEELLDEVDERETAVERLRAAEFDEIVELHAAANELELEVEQLEADLDRTEDRFRSVQERLDELADLESEREDLRRRLEEARTRIERLENEAVEAFNDHMATVLDVLGYENVERIWLDRVEREVQEGRQKTRRGFFELHVIRSTDSGTVYEDSISHLSESEREVTGLVFALAGYLVHDVHERVPFMLLDSIEAVDANRIATLVDYLADYADYLVVALLPEDAQALDEGYNRITEI